MIASIKKAFQCKTFTICFIICFALSTPIFVKIGMEDIEAGKMTIVHGVVMVMQYLFCIVSMPTFMARTRT